MALLSAHAIFKSFVIDKGKTRAKKMRDYEKLENGATSFFLKRLKITCSVNKADGFEPCAKQFRTRFEDIGIVVCTCYF